MPHWSGIDRTSLVRLLWLKWLSCLPLDCLTQRQACTPDWQRLYRQYMQLLGLLAVGLHEGGFLYSVCIADALVRKFFYFTHFSISLWYNIFLLCYLPSVFFWYVHAFSHIHLLSSPKNWHAIFGALHS